MLDRVNTFNHSGIRRGLFDLEDGWEIVDIIGIVFSATGGLVKFQKGETFKIEDCEVGHKTIRQSQTAMIDRVGTRLKFKRTLSKNPSP